MCVDIRVCDCAQRRLEAGNTQFVCLRLHALHPRANLHTTTWDITLSPQLHLQSKHLLIWGTLRSFFLFLLKERSFHPRKQEENNLLQTSEGNMFTLAERHGSDTATRQIPSLSPSTLLTYHCHLCECVL